MRNGKGTGDGITQIWTVVTKKTKMGSLGQRSVATAFAHQLWPLLSSPTRQISVLAVAFDKTLLPRIIPHSSHFDPSLKGR